MSSERDDLITALLDPGNVRVETVSLAIGGAEHTIGVRQMSIGIHGKLSARLYKAHKAEDLEEISKVKQEIVKECAVDGDGKPLFVKPADFARIKDQAGTGWIDRVFEVAMKLMAAPNQRNCKIELEPAVTARAATESTPAVEAKPAKICGGLLVLGEPKCPRCGGDVPNALEASLGN